MNLSDAIKQFNLYEATGEAIYQIVLNRRHSLSFPISLDVKKAFITEEAQFLFDTFTKSRTWSKVIPVISMIQHSIQNLQDTVDEALKNGSIREDDDIENMKSLKMVLMSYLQRNGIEISYE